MQEAKGSEDDETGRERNPSESTDQVNEEGLAHEEACNDTIRGADDSPDTHLSAPLIHHEGLSNAECAEKEQPGHCGDDSDRPGLFRKGRGCGDEADIGVEGLDPSNVQVDPIRHGFHSFPIRDSQQGHRVVPLGINGGIGVDPHGRGVINHLLEGYERHEYGVVVLGSAALKSGVDPPFFIENEGCPRLSDRDISADCDRVTWDQMTGALVQGATTKSEAGSKPTIQRAPPSPLASDK